eukprot:scaffold186_cov257-Pinguiococcus_pyrenoidosus.AAC.3
MSAMLRFGGLLGVSAIGAGTYGAHGLEGHLQELQLEEEEKLRWMKNWSSATGIHQFGATTVMALAAAQKAGLLARPALIGGLIGTGTGERTGGLEITGNEEHAGGASEQCSLVSCLRRKLVPGSVLRHEGLLESRSCWGKRASPRPDRAGVFPVMSSRFSSLLTSPELKSPGLSELESHGICDRSRGDGYELYGAGEESPFIRTQEPACLPWLSLCESGANMVCSCS